MRRLTLMLTVFDSRARRLFYLAVVGSILLAILDSLGVVLILPLMDLATGSSPSRPGALILTLLGLGGRDSSLGILIALVVSLFIVKDLGSLAFSWWSTGFMTLQRVQTSTRLMRRFLTMPYTAANERSPSELMRTMTDAVGIMFNSSVAGLMQLITNAFSIAWLVAALLWVSPLTTVVLCAYFVVAALIFNRASKNASRRFGVTMAHESMQAWKWVLAAFGGLKEIHLRGAQDLFVGNYEKASVAAARAQRASSFVSIIPKYLLEIMFIIAVGLVLLVSAGTSPSSSVVGLLAVFVTAGFRVMPAVTGFLAAFNSIQVGQASLELVAQDCRLISPADDAETPTAPRQLRMTGDLLLRNVSFKYPASPDLVVDSVSLSIPKGTSLGLVGASGAGKTTLIDLILGFHIPSAGSITIGGHNVFDDLASWRKNLGYVPQDVYILDASLAENIAFDSRPDEIDDELLASCAMSAQLGDLIAGSHANLHLPLGERGSRLSGGQRQRVGIARALYRRPSILVLDEATSALDNRTEHEFTRAIDGLKGKLTTIVVAHRLSTVRHLDQIAFLKDGKLAATGSFEELLDMNPDFAELVRLGGLDGS